MTDWQMMIKIQLLEIFEIINHFNQILTKEQLMNV